ncbi:MAG: chemotaxis protein CheA [Spirochaetaceae bacterium]|nr:chemotaxis protein CheA [Spirochaetaceae bacterium]
MSDYLDANNEELLKDFFSEAEQQVENLESNILVIENDPTNTDAIDEIFRAAHTLKGGSATVEMTELSTFTHVVEDLLDAIRGGNLSVSENVVDVLLTAIDVIKSMLAERSAGSIYQEDVEPLKDTLRSFIPSKKGDTQKTKQKDSSIAQFAPQVKPVQNVAPVTASGSLESLVTPVAEMLSEYDILELKQACNSNEKLYGVTVIFDESNPMNTVGGIQVFAALKEKGTLLKTIPDFDVLYEDEFQQKVVYILSSGATPDELEDAAFLDDVSLITDAQLIENGAQVSSPVVSPAVQETPKVEPSVSVSQAKEPEVAVAVPEKEIAKVEEKKPAVAKEQPKKSSVQGSGSVLRVDSKRIDSLLNLVSETVITKAAFNQSAIQFADLLANLQITEASYKEKIRLLIEQIPNYIEMVQNGSSMKDVKLAMNNDFGDMYTLFDSFDSSFKACVTKFKSSTQNLGRIAGELQEGVMKIRMVPINQIFSRFPRVVRDLSRDLEKKINLIIEGEDTELDKSVVEDLLDPIMHCVRNSLDHGVEVPMDRLKAGKSEEGSITLKASNEGNMIVIDIIDDGRGIDVKRVREKAIERGLIHPNKIISDQEAFQLIFEPGFSTAKKITNVSGRGVGLDVVKTQVEKLNGSVVVTSELGKGTKFSIRLPLTLAIIQGLLVRVGEEVYSIPIVSVIESHRIKKEEINTIDNYEVINVRNEVISVLRLSRLFQIKNTNESEYCFIVIVGTADKKIGVMVDALIGEEDVVIKPLRDQFTVSPGIAGASILGDGSVSLIIDVSQLLELGVKQELNAREEQEIMFS